MAKFPDFSGFWEFPKGPNVISIFVQNSQELGKCPESSHTGDCEGSMFVLLRNPVMLSLHSCTLGLGVWVSGEFSSPETVHVRLAVHVRLRLKIGVVVML